LGRRANEEKDSHTTFQNKRGVGIRQT
jgi:hypothetical protein